MIKGGGAALTREKSLQQSLKSLYVSLTTRKRLTCLASSPLPVEVIPMARSYVARELVKLGGDPAYREGVVTDNGNIILDVHNMQITNPKEMEDKINGIAGVVTVGLLLTEVLML